MTADVRQVLDGSRKYAVVRADCLPFLRSLPDDSVDLILGSPPYMDARTYGIGAQRDCMAWVEWMLEITEAAARVAHGPVFWVCCGVTRDRNYWPGCEGLAWEWWKRGGTHQLYRPCCFYRSGISGSGGDDYLRADWEFVLCFKRPGKLAWSDNTACGRPPKFKPGGAMSHRLKDGRRVRGRPSTPGGERSKNGEKQFYVPPDVANPGNVIRCDVGGGRMGSMLAHQNEAPYPEPLPEFFIRSFCPPGGVVLDPFSGSGTTGAVAVRLARRFIGCDLRQSQVDLSLKRISGETPDMWETLEAKGGGA